MKVYNVIINNGEWYEDNYERSFGIFDTHEKAEQYKNWVLSQQNNAAFVGELQAADEFAYNTAGCGVKWEDCIEEMELNVGLF